MGDNIYKNRIVAYQQYVDKVEKRLNIYKKLSIITVCTSLILSAYIVMERI